MSKDFTKKADERLQALGEFVDKRDVMLSGPFIERPVGPLEFIDSADFLNDKEGFIRPALRDDMELIFSGEDYKPICNLFLDNEGIGSGKSTKIALFYSFLIMWLHCLKDPFGYFGLFESQMAFMNMAPNAKVAKDILFAKVSLMMSKIGWFKDHNFLPDPRIKSELKFYKNAIDTSKMSLNELEELEESKSVIPFLSVTPGNSSENFPLGRDIFGAGIDEGNFFMRSTSRLAADPLEEILNGLNKRRQSRFKDAGICFVISSAGTFNTYMERLMQRVEIARKEHGLKEDDIVEEEGMKILARRRPLWEADPDLAKEERFFYQAKMDTDEGKTLTFDLHIPIRYKNEFRRNPSVVLRDIASIPTHALAPYITNWDMFKSVFNADRRDPAPIGNADTEYRVRDLQKDLPPDFVGRGDIVYYSHIDGAKGAGPGTDRCAISLTHRTKGGVFVDLIASFKGSIHDPITLGSVKSLLVWLKEERNFIFGLVTLDRWQSNYLVEELNAAGIRCEQQSVKAATMDNMRQMGYSGAFDCYYRPYLAWELQSLEDRGDGVKPDHSENSHNDESEALAKGIENAIDGQEPLNVKKRYRPRGAVGRSLA